MDEPLFKSAHAAITFALNYSNTEHVERSPASKMADTSKGSGGKGLIGLDGAAQSGMIQAELKKTGQFHEACIIARIAKRKLPCSCGAQCCSKHKPNYLWLDAINFIAMEAKRVIDADREVGVRGIMDHPAMRRAIIAKFFGEHVKIGELAKACEVSDVTVASHSGKINKLLKKIEGEAWIMLEEQLRANGVVGEI